MVVKSAEQESIISRLRERQYKANKTPWRLRDYGHAMVIKVMATEGSSECMALIQLIRPPDASPFDADDEYLVGLLADQFAHCLRRARLLAVAQETIGQLQKLHTWGVRRIDQPDQVAKLASSLFTADEVALYALKVDGDADGRGKNGPSARFETVTMATSTYACPCTCTRLMGRAHAQGTWACMSKARADGHARARA